MFYFLYFVSDISKDSLRPGLFGGIYIILIDNQWNLPDIFQDSIGTGIGNDIGSFKMFWHDFLCLGSSAVLGNSSEALGDSSDIRWPQSPLLLNIWWFFSPTLEDFIKILHRSLFSIECIGILLSFGDSPQHIHYSGRNNEWIQLRRVDLGVCNQSFRLFARWLRARCWRPIATERGRETLVVIILHNRHVVPVQASGFNFSHSEYHLVA